VTNFINVRLRKSLMANELRDRGTLAGADPSYFPV